MRSNTKVLHPQELPRSIGYLPHYHKPISAHKLSESLW